MAIKNQGYRNVGFPKPKSEKKKEPARQAETKKSSTPDFRKGYANVGILTEALRSLTDNQRAALDAAKANHADAIAESRYNRPEDTAYYQFAQAIKEMTREDGTVDYDPNGYRFNPYSDGLPDETARKAYDSLSYGDRLKLKVGKTGKPQTPDFGDPNVDTSVYDRYQQALRDAEEAEKAAAEQGKVRAKEAADRAVTSVVSQLYQKNRDNWQYDPKADAKAIKEANPDTTLTQTEIEALYRALQAQYGGDDDAYREWAQRNANAVGRAGASAAKAAAPAQPAGAVASAMTAAALAQPAAAAQRDQTAGKPDVVPIPNSRSRSSWAKGKADRAPIARHDPSMNSMGVDDVKDIEEALDRSRRARYATLSNGQPVLDENGSRIPANTFRNAVYDILGTHTVAAELKDIRKERSSAGKVMKQLGDDAKYVANQAIQGVGDVAAGLATVVGLGEYIALKPLVEFPRMLLTGDTDWSVEEARRRLGELDTLLAIGETGGSGKHNAYNTAGIEDASGAGQFIGNLGRAFTSSLTAAALGSVLGAAAPGLNKTVSFSNLLGSNSPAAVKVLAKVIPDFTVGVSSLPFMTQCFGNGFQEAKGQGYDDASASIWGAWQALAEGLPEAISWNISFGAGSSVKSRLLGGISQNQAKNATKAGMKGLFTRYGAQKVLNALATVARAANSEGMQEVMTNYLEWFGRRFIMGQEVDLPTLRENVASYSAGALLSGITQGLSYSMASPAHKQAQAIMDGMAGGTAPTAEQAQVLIDANSEEAAKAPLTNVELEAIEGQGLKVDPQVVEKYRAANDALTTAEQRIATGLQKLAEMNQQGVPSDDSMRKQTVESIVSARGELMSLRAQRDAAHVKYIDAVGGIAENAEKAVSEASTAQQQSDAEFAQWQVNDALQNNPQAVVDAVTEMRAAIQTEIETAKAQLRAEGTRMDAETRDSLMQRVTALEASAEKLNAIYETAQAQTAAAGEAVQQVEAESAPVSPPTIAQDAPTNAPDTDVTPEAKGAVRQSSALLQAQEIIKQYREAGANDEQIMQMARDLLDDEDGDVVRIAQEVLSLIGAADQSIAQRYIAEHGSRAKEGRVTDLLNIARQESVSGNAAAAEEAGISAAREVLVNTVEDDPSIVAIKQSLRSAGIAPSAEERAQIAATYDSYDAYRRAVAGVVPLSAVGKQGSVSIDQAIGALAQQFPGQVTGDDRVQWLYEFARNHPAGAAYYDGDLDADARALWERIAQENPEYFAPTQRDQTATFEVPDFADKAVRVNKAAVAQWVRDTVAAGANVQEIREYAKDKRITALTGKERHFWDNVSQQTTQPGRQEFREMPDEKLVRETIHLFDGSSPYVQATGLGMQTEPSTYPRVRSLDSIKRDIQQIVGFTYSDEHFSGAARRRGAIAYYEPAHNFVSSSDTNNITAFLHETGHAIDLENYAPDEVAVFREAMPADFIDQYDPAVQPAEASAEMFRAWMLNPTTMEERYPETFTQMREALGRRRYNRLREQGNAVRRFMQSDTATRINAVLRDTRRTRPTPIAQRLRNALKTVADSGYGYKKLDRAMQRAGVELAGGSADARNAQARTSSEAVNALFFEGMYDPATGNRVAPALSETVRNVRTEEDVTRLNVYLELKQAMDRYGANPQDWVFSISVCTPAEARAYILDVELNHANVVEAAQNLWAWLKTYRDTQISDAIPQSVKDEWESRNPHYIPQTRAFTLDIKSNVRGGRISGQGTGINHRRVGSTRDILSPIDAIANMVARTKTAAMKHDVLVALEEYYDADSDGAAGAFFHEIDPQLVPHTVPADVIRRQTEEALAGAGMADEDIDTLDETLRDHLEDGRIFEIRTPEGRAGNAFAITRDGNTRYFEVYDQDLYDALTTMKAKEAGAVLQAVRKVSGFVSSLITAKNPAFALGNAARDIQEAYFTGSEQNPVLFARDYLAALADVVRNTDPVRQYRAMGGSGGLSSAYATARNVNDLKRAMFGRAGDDRNLVKQSLDALGNAVETINGSIETVPRLAEYKRQVRQGTSYAEAIKAAKNCTTDFSTHGKASAIDGALWKFFNASVQSAYKAGNLLVDGLTTRQGRQRLLQQSLAMLTMGVAGRALAEWLLQMGDDDGTYEALPDYIKEDYWIIPTNEKGKYIRIPLPNGALMRTLNSLGRRIGLAAMGIKEGDAIDEVLGEQAMGLMLDFIEGLSPFGEINKGNPLGSNFNLNAPIQWASNTSWTGAPIVPASMEGLSPALQYNDKTSHLARYIGSVLNISPMKIDNLISQNSGVIGEVNDAISAGLRKGKTDGALAGAAKGIKEFFLSRFMVDTAYSQNVTNAFYEQRTQLNTFISDVNATIERDGLPSSPILRDLNPKQVAAAQAEAKALKKQMDELSKRLSELGQLANQAAEAGDEDKARAYRFKQQEYAAEASLRAAEFFDRWKTMNR